LGLNDPTYVEAARALAQRVLSTPDPVTLAFRRATARYPTPEERKILLDLYREELDVFQKDPAAAARLVGIGESKAEGSPVELAAWTVVMSTILNLDEVITKP
jgi:hypothetical protein